MALILLLLGGLPARAQIRAAVVADGLVAPTAVVQDPLDPLRRFVVEQAGRIRLVGPLGVLPGLFLDLTAAIASGGERGLLGLAFPRDHAASRRFYVSFTDVRGDTVVARFRRSALEPSIAEPGSRFDFRWPTGQRSIPQPFSNHNGGHLAFGPDGYLYVGLGDGGDGNDPDHRAQDPSALLGKILRLDVSVPDGDPAGYRIPPDNPFLDGAPVGALGEIWAFGLRNPWQFSFDDPAIGGTGALVIADVGQNAWEEVDYEPAGAGGRNYGWRNREGANPHVGSLPPAYVPLTDPIHQYPHVGGASITGGFVYRGTLLDPTYRGRYFFADYIQRRIQSLGLLIDPPTGDATVTDVIDHTAALGGGAIVGRVGTFGVSATGEIFFANHETGQLLQIVPADLAPPGPPSGLAATVTGADVALDWTAPRSGGPVAHYFVEAGSSPGEADRARLATSSVPHLSVSDVAAGSYFVRVRGANPSGAGDASNEVLVTIEGAAPCAAPPGAPVNLAATIDAGLAGLSWTAPPGPQPDAYVIEVGSSAGGNDLGVFETVGSVTSLVGTGPPGRYFVRARARNACGTGPSSNGIEVVLP